MRFSALLRCFALLALAGVMGAQASASEGDFTGETPLIVIRFNQRHVSFERPLYNVMSRALQAKPGVMFDLAAVAPSASESSRQEALEKAANQDASSVVAAMERMGLPPERISLTHGRDNVPSPEVRIYVH
jgi:hypothetical protein